MMDCTLESIYLIYIPECSYYTNKHLLNSRSRVLSDGDSANLDEVGVSM